jgi:hypothetical protein
MVVQAKLWGESVGELFYEEKRNQVFFKYKDTFLNKGLEISPILMPTNSKIDILSFPFLPAETFKGLPPVPILCLMLSGVWFLTPIYKLPVKQFMI